MRRLARLRSFLYAALFRERVHRQMEADLQFHLGERTDDLVARGMDRAEAARRARRELGDVGKWLEEGREARGLRWLDDLRADVIYGVRWLRGSPAFAATAVFSLAIGIGANAAIFNLLNVVLLRSLPVSRPEELVELTTVTGGNSDPGRAFSYSLFQTFRQQSRSLSDTMATAGLRLSVGVVGADDATATGLMASGNYYTALGVPAVIGRPILPEDDGPPGTGAVAVLSYGYWQRRFGGDVHVLGRIVSLNGLPFTIIGVTGPEFFGTHVGESVDVTVPLSMQPSLMSEIGGGRLRQGAGDFWLELMGRLRRGETVGHAQAELNAIYQQELPGILRNAGPKARMIGHPQLQLEPGSRGLSELRRRFSRPLSILMGAVLLVLLISCANVASLLLARAAARRREMAIRVALGAGRLRLVRQLVAESMMLALAGGGVGMLLAVWTSQTLAALLVDGNSYALAARPDGRVLAFTFTVSLLTGLAFGLAPALGVARTPAYPALKDGGGVVAGGRRFGVRGSLIVVQVAMSVLLLVSAALFVRTLMNLRHLNLGIDQPHLLALRLEPRGSNQKRQNEARLRQIYEPLVTRVRAVPGVQAASLAGSTPLSSQNPLSREISVPGYVQQPGEDMHIQQMQIYPGYFDALGAPLLAGRDLEETDDRPNSRPVAVVNETMARRFFGSPADAIGRAVGTINASAEAFEIVGVAGDTRDRALREAVAPAAFSTFAQTPTGRGQMTLIVRVSGDPRTLASTIRQLAREADPTMPVSEVETLDDRIKAATRQEQLVAWLSALFGAVAALLAAIGLYGLLAYTVAHRQMELGVRLALGATPRRLGHLVVRDSLVLVGAGLVAGLVLAAAAARSISHMLFGLPPLDGVSFAAASMVLLGVAVLAAWVPARHASQVDPIAALRQP